MRELDGATWAASPLSTPTNAHGRGARARRHGRHRVALETPVIPVWNDDEVVFADEPGIAGVPDRRDDSYLQTLRDTQLLAGAWPRAEADGRTAMATNPDNYDSPRQGAAPDPASTARRLTGAPALTSPTCASRNSPPSRYATSSVWIDDP